MNEWKKKVFLRYDILNAYKNKYNLFCCCCCIVLYSKFKQNKSKQTNKQIKKKCYKFQKNLEYKSQSQIIYNKIYK